MLPSSVAISDPSDTLVRISHLRSIGEFCALSCVVLGRRARL
jgi:hypothetical protein